MKKFIIIFVTLIVLGFFFYSPITESIFYGPQPIKYWFRNPTNFKECVEITGRVMKSLPAQCEVRGLRFSDK